MELNKTSSAQTVASIDDLLIEIFLSIPLKPLFRLKLVSKHWNFLISNQNFNFFWNQNPNPAVGLVFRVVDQRCCPSTMVPYLVSFDKQTNIGPLFRPSQWPCATLSSCNGLLLCKRTGRGIDEPKQRYFVCNPTTNKHFFLPKLDAPDGTCDWQFHYRMYLAFDPSKSPHYKVVCAMLTGSRPLITQLAVYSSETGCWTKHGDAFSSSAHFYHGVYWNGAIHWISLTNTGQSLYFNPDNDQVPRVMPTPPMKLIKPHDSAWSSYFWYFGESCGHLHYIEDYKAGRELNVYEMMTDYSEWFVKYRVDCSLIDNYLVSITRALIRGKKDEESFLVLQSGERIIRYNLFYKTCETIHEKLDATDICSYRIWRHPLQYIESVSHV